MDFSVIELDEGTESFWNELRSWLDDHATEEMLQAEWRAGDGHNPEFHRALGAKGWAFPNLPVEEGGAGLNPLQCRILQHELSARHVPTTTRGTTELVMLAVRRWMNGPVRDGMLPRVVSGEICFCLGYSEPDAGSDLASIQTRAVRDGNEWVITGQKMWTTGAQHCDYCFLLARTDPKAPKHKGLTMFLVPLNSGGVEVRKVRTLGGERTNTVFFDAVRVDDDYRLGPEGQGWMVIHGPLNVEHRMSEGGPTPVEEEPGEAGSGTGADLAGHTIEVFEPAVRAAVDWAHIPGPAGRRPIDDPTVRVRLAEIELGLAAVKATPGPQGRVVAGDTFIRSAAELLDLLGPSGLLTYDEPSSVAGGWIEYAHRFAQACAIYGGTTEIIRNLLAEHFLQLPRSRARS